MITNDKIKILRKLFTKLDVNGDGRLSK